jgi:hypothetical protein
MKKKKKAQEGGKKNSSLNVRIPEEKQTSHPWKFDLFAIFKMLSAALFLA